MEETCETVTLTLPTPGTKTPEKKGEVRVSGENQNEVLVLSNGDIQYEERSMVDPGGGKVLEMYCTTQSDTENGLVTETYSSRLCENVKLENGEVVTDKQYEESAIKTSLEKKETGEEKVDTTRLHYEENERTRDTKAGNKMKEFCATKEEKQEVSTTELDPSYEGPNKKYLKRSRNSFSKSSVKHQSLLDDGSDTDPDLLVLRDSLINQYTPGSYVSKAMAATKDKALETYSATSSRCDYSEKHPGDEDGDASEGESTTRQALTQAGGEDEQVLYNSQEASTGHSMAAGADEMGAKSDSGSNMESSDTETSYIAAKRRAGLEEKTSIEQNSYMANGTGTEIKENGVSRSESSSRASSAHVQVEDEVSAAHVTKSSRATSDSGISVSGKISADTDHSVPLEPRERNRKSSPPFSGPYAYSEDRRSADELIKRILADSNLEPSPMPARKFKVDMDGRGDSNRGDAASYTTEESSEFDDSPASSHFVERPLSTERRAVDGRPSLLERRLENLSKDKRYNLYTKEQRESSSFSHDNRMYSREEERNYSPRSMKDHEGDRNFSPRSLPDHDGERNFSPRSLKDHEGEIFLNEETIYMKKKPRPKTDDGEIFLNEETIYMKKKKKSASESHDEFASEVCAMKDKYKEGQEDQDMEYQSSLDGQSQRRFSQRRQQGSFEDRYQSLSHADNLSEASGSVSRRGEEDRYSAYSSQHQRRYMEDEELSSAYSMQNSAYSHEEDMQMVPFQPRGRMMRQQYVEDDDDVFDDRAPPPPRPNALPEEAFRPQRSEDTEIIVQERTQEIKRVVEQQGDVLKKLKEASESFDDLNAEIKQMKQDFLERQIQRQMTLEQVMKDDDEEDDPYAIEYEPENKPMRHGRQLAITSGHEEFDYGASSYNRRYSYGGSSFRSRYSQGQDYSYGTKRDQEYEDGDEYGEESRPGVGLRSLASRGYGQDEYSASTAYGYKRKNYQNNRSKTMYDDPNVEDGDVESTRFDNDEESSIPSYSKKFGSYAASQDDASSTASGYSSRKYGSYSANIEDTESSVSKYRSTGRKYGSYSANTEDTESSASGYRSKYGSYGGASDSGVPSYRRRFSFDGSSMANGDTGTDDDNTPSYRRSYRASSVANNYSSSYKSSYGSGLGSGSTDTPGYTPYVPRSARLQRSQTVSSYDSSRFDSGSKYSSSSFGRGVSDKPFTSRFLTKVRESKAANKDSETETPKRDKPFTSRFLRSSFDTSSSYKSRYSSRSASVGDIRTTTKTDTNSTEASGNKE
jgi:hypothetical protein